MKKLYKRCLNLWVMMFILYFISAPYLYADTINHIDDIGINYGVGFDSLAEQVKRSPLINRSSTMLPGGQRVDFDMKQISSSLELESSLDLSIEGSIGSGILGKVSAKASYMRENAMNQYSLYYLIAVKVKNMPNVLAQDPNFTQAAIDVLQSPSGLRLFHQAYGDSFVSAITTGGEYYGIIQINTKSEHDHHEVAEEISAGGWGWNAKQQLNATLDKMQRERSVTVKNIIIGGRGVQPTIDVDKMFQTAATFANNVYNYGVPLRDEICDYTVFPEYARIFTDLNLDERILLNRLRNNYLDYLNLKNDIDYVRNKQNQFRFKSSTKQSDLNKLRQQSTTIRETMTAISYAREKLISGQSTAKTLAALGITPAKNFAAQVRLPARYKTQLPTEPILIPTKSAYPLPGNTRGDSDMGGHKPRINMNAKLNIRDNGQQLHLHYDCTMKEDRSDWTTFTGSWNEILYDARRDFKGLRFKRVRTATGSLYAQAGSDDHGWQTYPGSGLIKRAREVRSDVSGKETGKIGAKYIDFNDPLIELVHEEDYLNLPYAYQNAAMAMKFRKVNVEKLKIKPINVTGRMTPTKAMQIKGVLPKSFKPAAGTLIPKSGSFQTTKPVSTKTRKSKVHATKSTKPGGLVREKFKIAKGAHKSFNVKITNPCVLKTSLTWGGQPEKIRIEVFGTSVRKPLASKIFVREKGKKNGRAMLSLNINSRALKANRSWRVVVTNLSNGIAYTKILIATSTQSKSKPKTWGTKTLKMK